MIWKIGRYANLKLSLNTSLATSHNLKTIPKSINHSYPSLYYPSNKHHHLSNLPTALTLPSTPIPKHTI